MNEKIKQLLEVLREQISDREQVADAQLAEYEQILLAAADTAAEARDVASLKVIKEGVEAIRTEAKARIDSAEAAAAEVQALMAEIEGEADEPEGEEPAEAEGEGEEVVEDEPVEAPADEPAPEVEAEAEPVAAAAEPKSLPSLSGLAKRRPKEMAPQPTSPQRITVSAGSDVAGFSAGQDMDRAQIGKAMHSKLAAIRTGRADGQWTVATVHQDMPPERRLDRDSTDTMAKLNAVLSPEALTASGGICAPSEALYDIFNDTIDARPLRAALPGFQATRGGIRFIAPSIIQDLTSGVGVHTNDDDVSGATKNIVTIECGDETECTVQAITARAQLGNFHQMFHVEQVDHNVDLLMAAHARLAENTLWNTMCTNSTAVTAGVDSQLGAGSEFYAILARTAATYRHRNRYGPDRVLRLFAPAWFRDLLRADFTRQAPGDDRTAVSNAQIDAWLGAYGISPAWVIDAGTTNPTFFDQGVGPVIGWPDTVEVLLFAEGTHVFLDGGELNLGVVRDSTLNATNDFQLFSETMEQVCIVGQESLCLTLDLCASGIRSGLDTDPVLCGSGS